MKKTLYILLLLGSVLTACSDIAEDERLTYFDPTIGQVEEEDPDSVEELTKVDRNILIEDFTGQRCINCPDGAQVIEQLLAQYGDTRIIPVAIHCGPFGFEGNASVKGFATVVGTIYWNKWFADRNTQPIAQFNRSATNDHIDEWSLEATKISQYTTYISLQLTATYDATSRQVGITTQAVAPAGTLCSFQLWLIEDGIIGLQKMPDGSDNFTYVHNHILRQAINGTWGETVQLGKQTTTLQHSVNLPNDYNADNCYVVAFVYDNTGVKQVAKAKCKQ